MKNWKTKSHRHRSDKGKKTTVTNWFVLHFGSWVADKATELQVKDKNVGGGTVIKHGRRITMQAPSIEAAAHGRKG